MRKGRAESSPSHPMPINVIQVQAEGAGDQIPEQGQTPVPPQVCVVYTWGH